MSGPMERQRMDEVRIELPNGIVLIPCSSRDALLEQLETRDSITDVPDVRDVFLAAGTSRPVRLTDPQKLALRKVITFWANEVGGSYEDLTGSTPPTSRGVFGGESLLGLEAQLQDRAAVAGALLIEGTASGCAFRVAD